MAVLHESVSAARPHGSIVAAGIVALAMAMGIGRFAFTPLLPLMQRDGSLSAIGGAEWAAANYAGYLVGAMTAARFSADPRRGLNLALVGVGLTTLAIALLGFLEPRVAHVGGVALRALAGVFSAWALVCASSWCLAELARRQAPKLGAWIYTGVGLGIALAGVMTWLGGQQPADWLWLELGALALVGAVFVRRRTASVPLPPPVAARAAVGPARAATGHLGLVMCYGIMGLGYIVPATFLPMMARQQVADPLVFGLTWPLFGLAAAGSVAAAARWLGGWQRLRIWAVAHAAMALGTALPLISPSLWSLAGSAVLVGGTFMVATMAGLQLAREAAPDNPTPLLARMTAAFAAGQILGPLLVRALGTGLHGGLDALAWSHLVATQLLLLTAWWLWRAAPAAERQVE
ncbi:MAG TPA: YbfB/YjiJ family MFS transporter [Ottowia sp.]|uniref:YbfB/YjiJ family MFS transporter n=1 Tax=Ottowia sp. TaxID=1898956 RepID=UPI002C50108A|nr:YbfB/YjiJ family MFS transporter [Ottowia sp.]HRQ02845.1 YbfB/YjiJ family MFS transporter [Ottowia sp.]